MSEGNIYNNSNNTLTIKKYTESFKNEFISFVLSFEIDELISLNVFDKELSKENMTEEKINSLINWDKTTIYILEDSNKNELIGFYCLTLINEENYISFIIKKDKRNKGYGKTGLHILLKQLSSDFPDIKEYYFKIQKNNIYASLIVYGNNASAFKETDTENILKIIKNNNVWIHRATNDDLSKIMVVTIAAKKLLKSNGSLQWQQGYPNEETFTKDIQNKNLYGIFEDKELMGFGAYILGKDLNYVEIDEGKWDIPANDKDMAIHRVAVDENSHGKQYGVKILKYGIEYSKKFNCLTVKVDTHKKNIPMQKCILKSGFVYKGIIKILTEKLDNLRLAYEMVL
jgi:RimJ/RimL family protein N-acetyltransferase